MWHWIWLDAVLDVDGHDSTSTSHTLLFSMSLVTLRCALALLSSCQYYLLTLKQFESGPMPFRWTLYYTFRTSTLTKGVLVNEFRQILDFMDSIRVDGGVMTTIIGYSFDSVSDYVP